MNEFTELPRALVVDDDQFTLAMVGSVVQSLDYDVSTASTGKQALDIAREIDPDVVVIDLDLGPGPTGAEILERIQQEAPWTAGVVLSSHRSPELAGAKPLSTANVVYAVKGDINSAPALKRYLDAALRNEQLPQNANSEFPVITPNQAQLLRMLAAGMSNEAISRERNCTVRSVERMIARLFKSLRLSVDPDSNNRVRAVAMLNESKVVVR